MKKRLPAGLLCWKQPSRRGFIFVFTLVVLMVLTILGLLSIGAAMQTRDIAARKERAGRALLMAEAAAWTAKAYLESLPSPPDPNSIATTPLRYPTDNSWAAMPAAPTGTLPASVKPIGGKYQAKIYGIAGSSPSRYQVYCYGKSNDGENRTIVTQIEVASFSKYAYFENKTLSGAWICTGSRFTGPVHSNDVLPIYWDKSTGHPIFGDVVTSAQPTVNWYNKPQTDADWRNIFDGGQSALKLGVKPITIPASTLKQKHKAWKGALNLADSTDTGVNPAYPTATGVYLGANGDTSVSAGIYIVGNCTMNFQVDGSGRQQVQVVQGSTTTTLTIDRATNQTIVTKTGQSQPTTMSGVPNGMIYCAGGSITAHGTLADNTVSGNMITASNDWTIATDINNYDITVDNDLTCTTRPMMKDPNYPSDDSVHPVHRVPITYPTNIKPATLGIYARNVMIGNTANHPNYEIDAVIMAANGSSGTWKAANPNFTYNNQPGNVYVSGGIINYQAGLFGYLNGSGQISQGYAEHYYYDPRLGASPPPFFPTTGQLDIETWQEL